METEYLGQAGFCLPFVALPLRYSYNPAKIKAGRHHDEYARIELDSDGIKTLTEGSNRKDIVCYFRTLGYSKVGLDLSGYKSGSLNISINQTTSGIRGLNEEIRGSIDE